MKEILIWGILISIIGLTLAVREVSVNLVNLNNTQQNMVNAITSLKK